MLCRKANCPRASRRNAHGPGWFNSQVQPVQQTQPIDRTGATAVGVLCGSEIGVAYHAVIDMAGKPSSPSPQEESIITETTSAPVAQTAASEAEIVRVGADDWDSMKRLLMTSTVEELNRPSHRFAPADRARLAVVCRNRGEFDAKIRLVLSRWDTLRNDVRNQWAQEGVFFGEPRPGATTAFLFPGHGSQYPGMFDELIGSLPAARAAADQLNASLQALGMEPLDQLIGHGAEGLGKQLWKTQASILCADWIADCSLRSLGVSPGVVAGHSFGEYAALVSAGVWSITDGLRAARHRAESIEERSGVDGRMAATTAPPEVIAEVLAANGPHLWLANQNSNQQVVISGATKNVQAAVVDLTRRSFGAIMLNVPRPFHCPLLKDAAPELVRRLAGLPMSEARVPVISTIGMGELREPSAMLESLGLHFTSKVDFPAVLDRVKGFQPALVVEIGPKQVLMRLARTHFEGSDVVCMSTDNRQRPAELALLDVVAQADCLGCATPSVPASEPATSVRRTEGQFIVYDATQRRRSKMKAQSQQGTVAKAMSYPQNHGAADKSHGNGYGNGKGTGTSHTGAHGPPNATAQSNTGVSRISAYAEAAAVATPAASRREARAVEATVASPSHAPSLSPVAETTAAPAPAQLPGVDADQIRRVLIDFVVEQTGYPEEIIELDADLEGDLGIDSIKKAQLFGEVGAHFNIAPRDDLSLDDFPTLRHVVDFLVVELGADENPATQTSSSASLIAEEPQIAPATTYHEPPVTPAVEPVMASTPTSVETVPDETSSGVDAEEIRAVLVNFVVEQTGYPEEIIELDADLEGDLGIDSIKKAQLFGEVGAHFNIAPRDDLSLDDFPTLRHVVDFLVVELGADENPATQTSSSASLIAEEPQIAPATTYHEPPVTPAVEPVMASTPTSVETVPDETSSGVDAEEIRAVLVNFVVEQTGYPEEIIELDADLEGDLGIDSIKKAQLFGEVGAHFNIAPRDDLSLDDFPTLRHVVDFLVVELGADENPATQTSSSASLIAEEPQIAPATTYHEPPVTPAVEPVMASTPTPVETVPDETSSGVDAEEIRAVLVNFVVEQTGYPEEIIELDADLEGDLGIDSIKKAQLFGEVGAHFNIAPRDDLSLDDFPTLRHVVDFLVVELGSESGVPTPTPAAASVLSMEEPSTVGTIEPSPELSPVSEIPLVVGSVEQPRAPSGDMIHVVVLRGLAGQRGEQYGKTLQDEIREALATLADTGTSIETSGLDCWPCGLNEALTTAAAAAGVNQEVVASANALLEPLANWSLGFIDQPSSTGYAVPMPLVAHVHQELDAHVYLAVAEVCRLHARVGVNSARVAVSCEPLDLPARESDVVAVTGKLHQALARANSAAEAIQQLRDLKLSGGWCLGVSDPVQKEAVYIATSGRELSASDASQATPQQQAFHAQLAADPEAIRLYDRRGNLSRRLELADHLPAELVKKAAPVAPNSCCQEPVPHVMRRHRMRMTLASLPPSFEEVDCAGRTVAVIGDGEVAHSVVALVTSLGGRATAFDSAEDFPRTARHEPGR